jgi:phosphoribosyl-dephospho-CoA transferase
MAERGAAAVGAARHRRHELLYVEASAWSTALASCPLRDHPLVAGWSEKQWPVITRRRGEGDDPALVAVGVPLPPSEGKLRIPLTIPYEAVLRRTNPSPLRETITAAPAPWRATMEAACQLGAKHGVEPAAFGSMLWEHLTGLPYISATSDLDVLWTVDVGTVLPQLLRGVVLLETGAPMRIDGEISFRNGDAVNWRELHAALVHDDVAEVVVKTPEGARLSTVKELIMGAGA